MSFLSLRQQCQSTQVIFMLLPFLYMGLEACFQPIRLYVCAWLHVYGCAGGGILWLACCRHLVFILSYIAYRDYFIVFIHILPVPNAVLLCMWVLSEVSSFSSLFVTAAVCTFCTVLIGFAGLALVTTVGWLMPVCQAILWCTDCSCSCKVAVVLLCY